MGGGAVGVEMAGEIADKYSAKLITVIHSRSCLVSPTFGERFQTKLQDVLLEKNIQTLLGDYCFCFETVSGEFVGLVLTRVLCIFRREGGQHGRAGGRQVQEADRADVQGSREGHKVKVAAIECRTITEVICLSLSLNLCQGQSYASDIILDCTGLRPETTLTEHVFGQFFFVAFFRRRSFDLPDDKLQMPASSTTTRGSRSRGSCWWLGRATSTPSATAATPRRRSRPSTPRPTPSWWPSTYGGT